MCTGGCFFFFNGEIHPGKAANFMVLSTICYYPHGPDALAEAGCIPFHKAEFFLRGAIVHESGRGLATDCAAGKGH